MLARLFVIIGGLLVIALCSLLLAPFFVDWAGYRSAFEREASRIIGQPVRVEGTATARILPFPSVTFSNVVIDGADGIPAARIAAFSMDAELAPFLSGEILIFDMRIERPDVRVKLAENGALLWSLPQSEALQGKAVALENVNVTDGRITVERASSNPMVFGNINGKVSAQSLLGPWLADGRFVSGNTIYQGRFSTGAKVANDSLRVRVSLVPEGGFYEAAFDGQVTTQNQAPAYVGKLDLSVLGNAKDNQSKRQKIADLKGDFSIDVNGAKLSEAALVAGPNDNPYRADGSASLAFGQDARFDVKLKGQQISFGDIEGNGKADRVTLGVPLADRLAAIENFLAQIPVPDMPGQVDLALPALVVGDTIIRNAEVKASPAKAGWQIERFSVELPGRTIVEGTGNLALAEGLKFNGEMTLASKQPTGLVNWLGLKANHAIRALPNAGFTSRVDFDAKRQTFRDVEFRAGSTVLRGLIDRQIPEGARPQVSMQFSGENANFDVLTGLFGNQSQFSTDQDLDVNFSSAPVVGFGLQAEKLNSSLQISGGELKVEQIDLSGFDGADINLSGTVSSSFVSPQGTLDLTVAAIDPAAFLDALATRFPSQDWLKEAATRAAYIGTALADSKLTAAVKLGGTAAQTGTQGDFEYGFEGADLNFGGQGTFNNTDVSIAAKGNSNFGETLLAGLGVPVGDSITALQLLEPVAFEFSAQTKAGKLQSGTLKAAGNLDIFETSFGKGAQPFTLRLADAAPYAMSAGYGLPGAALGLPLSFKGEWEKTGTTLKLQKLEGAFVEVPISGNVDLIQGERLKITGNLKSKLLDRAVFDEIAFGPLSASGDEKAEFSGGLPFDADLALLVDEATSFAPMPIKNANARIVATKDALRLADIKAELAGGILTGTGEVRRNGPEALLSFNSTLAGADSKQISETGISGESNLQIELSAAGSNMESLKASLAGSGVVIAKNTIVKGLSTSNFESLIDEADTREIAPDAIATLEMATRKLMSGEIALPDFQTAFTVTAGVARAPRTLLKINGGTLAFEPKLDLNSGEAEVAASLLFDAGTEALTGTEPALNFKLGGAWNNLNLEIDVQPLQGFLGERALEREENRVEAIQSSLVEKQRLRRENRYYAGLIEERAKAEADRLAEIKRLEDEAAKAEQERVKQQQIEKEQLDQAKQKATVGKTVLQPSPPTPADPAVDQPLNLDGLIKELETKPLVQP